MPLCRQEINYSSVPYLQSLIEVKDKKFLTYRCHSELKTSCKVKFTFSTSYILLILIVAFLSGLQTAECFNFSISSSEIYTGVSANYYFTISSHSNPTNLIFTFSDWSPNQAQPFVSTYMVSENTTGNGLSCTSRIVKTVECNISSSVFPGSVFPSTIVLKINGIFNPFSLRPYSVSLYLNGTGGSSTQTANLTVSEPRVSSMLIDNYSYEVGKKSSAFLYLTFRNYLASNTFLNMTYNSALSTIDMISDTSYYVATDNVGLKRLSNWDNPSQSFRTLKMNITNPAFAISYTIQALQYFIDGGVEYKIQKFSLTIQITPTQFLQLSSVSPSNIIRLGTNENNLLLSSKCETAAVNGPSTNAFFQVTYDNSVINLNTGSTCVSSSTSGTTSICTLSIPNTAANSTNSFLLTKISSLILTNSAIANTSLTIESRSYFSTMAQFYTTCSSSLSVPIQSQVLIPTTSLTTCNQVVGQSNTLTFQANVENAAVNDVLVVKLNLGKIINSTGSISLVYNSALNQYEGVLSSLQIINSTRIQFPITFTNPTYIPSQQPSILLTLSRRLSSASSTQSNTYAQTTVSLNTCPVSTVLSNSTTNALTLTNGSTYKMGVDYSISLTNASVQFKDYALGDYFVVGFFSKVTNGSAFAETDSPFQLSLFTTGNVPVVMLNSQHSLATYIMSPSFLKITLNSSTVVSLINDPSLSSLLLTIKSLSNPFFSSDVYCTIKTYTSANLQKQTLMTTLSPITTVSNNELNLLTSSTISLLQSNNTINLQISSLSRKAALRASYSFITSIFVVVKAPFSCVNTNASNEFVLTLSSLNVTDFNISLVNCTLGYFSDYSQSIEVHEYARFSHSNLTQNIHTTQSTLSIKSTCGDQCYTCDSGNLSSCLSCFNSTYSTYNFFSALDNKCHQTCLSGTYSSASTCLACHPICATCTNGLFNSCSQCAVNYTMNSGGICESTCGSNMFLSSGVCASCNSNCEGCLNETTCYNCKSGAILVGSTCMFSHCQHPCQTCEGSSNFCLSCITSTSTDYYFHQNSCLETCPENSFQWQDDSNSLHPKVCVKIQSSNIYFVGIILSLISLGMGIGIRCCARKKAKSSSISLDERDSLIRTTKLSQKFNEMYGLKQSQQNLSITQIGTNPDTGLILESILKRYLDSPKTKIYKLDLLRFMTVLMGYIEIICVVVILAQGGIFNPTGVNQIIAVGLAGMFITNIIFGVRYFVKVYRKLSVKRLKFIQMNIKNKPNKIQIEPQPVNIIQEALQQQKSDQNNEENPKKQEDNPTKNIELTNPVNPVNPATHGSQESSRFNQISLQEKQRLKRNKKMLSDFDNEMIKELFIAILSTIFTLRTYNILRSNLFMIFSTERIQEEKPKGQADGLNQSKSPRTGQNSKMALNLPIRNNEMININKTQAISPKRQSPVKKTTKQSSMNVIKIQPKQNTNTLQLKKRQSERKLPAEPSVLLKKTISQPQVLISSIRPFNTLPQEQQSNPLLQIKEDCVNSFLHPFYTYIVLASLLAVSVMLGIASAILVFKNRYDNMMMWGVDSLIVIFFSFVLNIFDLWKAVNLSKHEQHSEMSTVVNEVNQTMENLKNQEEADDKIDLDVINEDQDVNNLNATKKLSTMKKYSNQKVGSSPFKNNALNMKGSIKEDEIDIDPFSKIKSPKSPKSPSQRTQKTKAFGSKQKSPNPSIVNIEYPEQKPPQLKIFDDLEEQGNTEKFGKPQKLTKDSTRKTNLGSKIRSSNRTLYGKKTEIGNQMLSNTTRGNKNKNYKMEDIFLGFLQNEERQQQVQVNQSENQDMTEADEIMTVKMENRDLLQSKKQSSVININSEDEAGDNDWKLRPLRIVGQKRRTIGSKDEIEEERQSKSKGQYQG